MPFFGQWVTAYFDHKDVEKRDLDTLSWVVPATDRAPTIFNIPPNDLEEMVTYGPDAISDLPFLFHFANQLKASYRKALYDSETFKVFPHLKITYLCANKTCAFAYAGIWALQDDEKASQGPRKFNYKWFNGGNHLVRCVFLFK